MAVDDRRFPDMLLTFWMTSRNGSPTNHMGGISCLNNFLCSTRSLHTHINKAHAFHEQSFPPYGEYLWPCFQIQHKGHIGNCISPFPLQQHSCFWWSPYFYGHSLVQCPENVKQIPSFLWITYVFNDQVILFPSPGSGSVCERDGLKHSLIWYVPSAPSPTQFQDPPLFSTLKEKLRNDQIF